MKLECRGRLHMVRRCRRCGERIDSGAQVRTEMDVDRDVRAEEAVGGKEGRLTEGGGQARIAVRKRDRNRPRTAYSISRPVMSPAVKANVAGFGS
jgi:hypothetical protein